MAKITLERATRADIQTYIDIDKRVQSKTYSALTKEDEVIGEMKKSQVYLIRNDENVVGTISYERKKDGTVYLSGLAIDPKYQGLGYARNALEQVLDQIKDAPMVELVTHPDNEKAIGLYKSLGFKVTGRKENYFGDGEPRIMLTYIKVGI